MIKSFWSQQDCSLAWCPFYLGESLFPSCVFSVRILFYFVMDSDFLVPVTAPPSLSVSVSVSLVGARASHTHRPLIHDNGFAVLALVRNLYEVRL